jgi:hypothetical protein
MTVPLVFADPEWAVTKLVTGRDWPAGTGAYTADTSGGRVIVSPSRGGGRPVLVLRSSGAGDARDLLDAGVDVLVTAEPAALSYAAGRPGITATPLPWDRTYALLGVGVADISAGLRAGLARDAVRTPLGRRRRSSVVRLRGLPGRPTTARRAAATAAVTHHAGVRRRRSPRARSGRTARRAR